MPLATSTITTLLESVTGTFYDYFIVVLNVVLPFAIGIGILGAVVGLGWALVKILRR